MRLVLGLHRYPNKLERRKGVGNDNNGWIRWSIEGYRER